MSGIVKEESTWTFGLELGMLYPSKLVLASLRQLAWSMGLEFEGHASRGLLGSVVQLRVSGDERMVQQYAASVGAHWS